jgi:hydrogenase-4 component B
MTGLTLAIIAAAGYLAAAAASLLAVRRVGQSVACAVSAAAGATTLVAGVMMLLSDRTRTLRVGAATVVGQLVLRGSPLAGLFLAVLGLIGVAVAGYARRYHHHGRGTAVYLAVYQLTMLACVGVLIAGTVPMFLIAWESMALGGYLLILRGYRRSEVAAGGFWFLALSEVGFVLIVAAFLLLATRTGSLDLSVIAARAGRLPVGVRSSAYLLALVGFGFKAGLVPLHVWLPEAHPVAPADGSAVLSGLVVKLGVYGIALFGFVLLGVGPAWWGLVTMGLGALSAVIGILYALTERDIKRFLAYSTIENIGVIVAALGAGMTFAAYRHPELAALMLIAALYHTANHASAKTLLFLEAGIVEHTTGSRDMDRLGGLIHRLPRSTTIVLIGTLGMAALPPLNGFVSEWLIFQGLFQGFRVPSHLVGILIVAAAATLGLTAGLAVNAFVRAFGIPYLGMPRTRAAADAVEDGQPVAGPGLLAAACVALGIGAPLVLSALARTAHEVTGTDIRPRLVIGKLTVIPAHTDFSALSPTYLAVYLIAVMAVPAAIYLTGRPYGVSRRAPVWDGGIVAFKPRMQYSAMTFASPVRVTFDAVYRPSVSIQRASDDPAGRSGPVHYDSQLRPRFHLFIYRPVVRAVEWLADRVRPIQSGDVNLYLLYVFLTVLTAYLLGAL